MGLFTPLYKNQDYKKRTKWIEIKAKINNLAHQKILEELAKNDKDSWVRKTAVKKLTDQNLLSFIVKNDKDDIVRSTAVERLTDQNLLTELAQNEKSFLVRKEAIKKLTSQIVLENIARKDKDFDARQLAYKKLGIEYRQEALADIAINGGYSSRRDAIQELTNQKALGEVVKKQDNYDLCKQAFAKISDDNVLADIINHVKGFDSEEAVKKINNTDILADIVKNHANKKIRHLAIMRGRFGTKDIVQTLINDMTTDHDKEASEVLSYLYKNAALSEEVKQLVLSQNGFSYDNHEDSPGNCFTGGHVDHGVAISSKASRESSIPNSLYFIFRISYSFRNISILSFAAS